MSVVASIPIQIRARDRADYFRNVPSFLPVRYAYCLLDLAADDSKMPNKVFKKNSALISKKISSEIIWQLPCRTNGKGYIVPVDENSKNHTWQHLYYRNDTDARGYIDKLPPLLMNLGMRFNLFWTYDRSQFYDTRNNKNIVVKENQLTLSSTMFNIHESNLFLLAMLPPSLNLNRTDKKKRAEIAQKLKQLFFRNQHKTNRFVIHSGFDGKRLIPHLPVEDNDLRHALGIADLIITASEAPTDKDYFGNIAILEEVLRIIKIRGEEKSLNDIIGLHTRCERSDSRYSLAKWSIENSFKNLENYIKKFRKLFEPLYTNAIVQAIGHYSDDEKKNYIKKLQKAAGICTLRDLWDEFLCSETNYKKKLSILKEVKNGKPPESFVDKILAWYQQLDAAGLDKYSGFVEATSKWVESFLPKLIKQKPDELASSLNRINHLLDVLDDSKNIDKEISEVFKVSGKDIAVSVKDASGKLITFNVRESLSKAAGISSRISNFCGVVNMALSLKDAMNNPEFKTVLKAMKDTADVANSFESIRSQLSKHFGLTESMLKRFAGSAMIVLSFIEASDHLKQGNNVAILGDMLVATAGTINILSKGGVAGWIAAGCVLAGTVIVYYSLDNDEKFLLNFDNRYWSSAKYATDHRFLRTENLDFRHHNDYLKTRGS